ncbi:MAG: endonuclease MutS2 [Lachnospiraceae bacterium]|nr:endonuclease MutS2 [Lachnospiraceae bacterium]
MNEKVLKTLEYHKIIQMLAECATSAPGRELCQALEPSTDLAGIELAQKQTGDALTRIFQKGSLSFSGTRNIGASLKRLEIGGTLSIEELLRVASLLKVTKRAKSYSRSERETPREDSLDGLFAALEPLTPLSGEINRCILSEDEIADDASARLKQIRRSIKNTNDRIHSQMNTMLNSSRNYLQDAVITMRNGRYCLPVKAESKNQVPGMIHDQSSTGSTLFIEPMSVVKLNNDLKELFLKEQEEIEVILADLSALTAEHIPALISNYEILSNLDFIFAKASLAKSYNGTAPLFNRDRRIRIRKGRHPLLDSRKVVPIDIHLGDDFNQLIITGPNTGGKTVSLKTVGLFTLMGQSGLHIPANDRSELSIFDEVFADIGDEQSIEQSLSTFSSHMTNIVSILDKVDEHSLVLFDELCAGTDPAEGAALAMAILSRLHNYGIRTMATTHYSELKVFALSTPGVENACCEFSLETLSPTYRLLIGIPGKSNAFAISSKLGLDADLIENARSNLTEQDESFEDLLSDLESQRITIEKDRLEAEQHKVEIARLKQKLEQKQERIDSQREKIIRQANEEAHAILREAKEVADQTIKNFHKYGKGSGSVREMEKERGSLRSKMDRLEKDMSLKQKEQAANHKVPKKLRIGDSVKVLSMNLKGTVHTLPNDKGDLYVQMGILRSVVNIKDLVLLEEDSPAVGKKHASAGTGNLKMSKSASVSTEINLIGKTTDEAIVLLDKYLDDAYLAHMPSVRIVHGKGTGALRKAVQNHLKRLKYVKSFRLGEFGEGDSGVTIAEFH